MESNDINNGRETLLRQEIAELRLRLEHCEAEAAKTAKRLANEELQEFSAIASHDLQEPLRKIISFGQRLHEDHSESLGPTGLDFLRRMENAAARMQQLLQNLLEYSRVTTKVQPFEMVDLAWAAGKAKDMLKRRIDQTGAQVEISSLPTVMADPDQMVQLFTRLLDNSLKFKAESAPQVHIQALEGTPGICVIQAVDNGMGFADDQAEAIFKPFFRLHGRGQFEGTGMGLAVCRKIVEGHGGTITAQSEPGRGAMFTVELPRHGVEDCPSQ